MKSKNLMPLTLLTLIVMSSSAFAQNKEAVPAGDQIIVTLPQSNVGSPLYPVNTGSNFGWPVGPWKSTSTPPSLFQTGKAYDNFMGKVVPDCPTYLLVCPKNSIKTYSLQNTNDDLIKYYTTKITSPIDCGYSPKDVNLDALMEVVEKTDVSSCYSSRGQDVDPERKDLAMLNQDKRACDCLTEKAKILDPENKGIGKILKGGKNQIIKKDDADDVPSYLKVLEDNVLTMRKKLDRSTDGLSFQASVVGAGKPEFAVAFNIPAGALSLGQSQRPGEAASLSGGAGGAVGAGPKVASLQLMTDRAVGLFQQQSLRLVHDSEYPKMDRALASSILENNTTSNQPSTPVSTNSDNKDQSLSNILSKISTPNAVNSALYEGEQSLTPKQCVGAREFMAFKQLPDDPLVQEELRDPSKMTADNWNYKLLRAQYDRYMAMGNSRRVRHKEKVLLLKGKLKFLERNPMFKTFLAADASDLDAYYQAKGITDPATKNAVAAKYSNIEQRKKDLMAMISKITPPKGCVSSDCIYGMAKSPVMQELKDNIRNFFSNPQNVELTVTENDKTGVIETAAFLNNPEKAFTSVPKVYTMANVEEAFQKTLQLGTPTECAKDPSMSVDTCTRIYAAWCVEINEKDKLIREQAKFDPAVIDDLDDSTKDYFEADINKNKELADFNQQICETKRKKSNDSSPESYRSFAQYAEEKCQADSSLCSTPAKMEDMRIAFLSEYQKPIAGNEGNDLAVLSFNAFIKNGRIKSMSKKDAQGMVARTNTQVNIADFNKMNEEWGYTDNIVGEGSNVAAGTSDSAISGKAETTVNNKIDNSSVIDEGMIAPNYSMSNAAGTSNAVAGSDQPQKVENMTDPQRQELLDDWQKEYDAWKNNKGNDGSPVASANEAAMKARIEALEALLSQQKKLTEDQYRLLNEAIAKQSNNAQNAVAQNQVETSTQSNGRNRSSSAILGNDVSDEGVVSRAPASIPEQRNTAGAGNGAGSAGVGSGSSSTSRRSSISSSDDVAREEAKLINMRSNSDGSLVISSVNNASGAVANALALPISDKQYSELQANPQSLNLSQLEGRIPKDQIAKLEKDGEITIILRNGSNPPFEVKVEKKNNKLVYSLKDKNGKDQAPVRRVFTRQSLELQLKANR